MSYCINCQKKTETVYNDFMVAFCEDCHKMRGKRSDYSGQRMPFKCLSCGRMSEEGFTGQKVCDDCAYSIDQI